MKRETVLAIIKKNPGCTGLDIHREITKQSRAAAWFGPDSIFTVLFGPSFGSIYVRLAELEKSRQIRGEWVDGPYPRRRVYHAVQP